MHAISVAKLILSEIGAVQSSQIAHCCSLRQDLQALSLLDVVHMGSETQCRGLLRLRNVEVWKLLPANPRAFALAAGVSRPSRRIADLLHCCIESISAFAILLDIKPINPALSKEAKHSLGPSRALKRQKHPLGSCALAWAVKEVPDSEAGPPDAELPRQTEFDPLPKEKRERPVHARGLR